MAVTVLKADRHRRMPWANGRGETTEIVRIDGDAGLMVRLSVADVVEPGPFSSFPGIDRQLVLVEGEGFDLDRDGAVVPVRPFEPVAFRGEADIAAVNLRGRSRDFNVMTARGSASARLAVTKGALRTAATDLFFAYVAAGQASHDGVPLGAGDCLAIDRDPGRTVEVQAEPATRLIAVHVTLTPPLPA